MQDRDEAVRSRGRLDGRQLRFAQAQGLLADDADAAGQRADHGTVVLMGRGRHHHQVEGVAIQELRQAGIARAGRYPERIPGLGRAALIRIGDGQHLDHVPVGQIGRQMALPENPPGAGQAHAYPLVHPSTRATRRSSASIAASSSLSGYCSSTVRLSRSWLRAHPDAGCAQPVSRSGFRRGW